MQFFVSMEKEGSWIPVGTLTGTDSDSICFSYLPEYLRNSSSCGISASLPLQQQLFSPEKTRTFFESLLPEGFTRQAVARSLHLDTNDYCELLFSLGRECLGALRISEEKFPEQDYHYTPLTREQVISLAAEGSDASAGMISRTRLSLAGASGKVGLYYHDGKWFFPCGLAASTYIVKQSHIRLHSIVANEQLCMLTAKKMGLPVAESFIFSSDSGKSDSSVLFATKRFDRRVPQAGRITDGLPCPVRLHQESFAQALGIPSENKYEKNPDDRYFFRMAELIKQVSTRPLEDLLLLWDAVVFDFLIGNTDNHLKNYSLLYSSDLKYIRLAPKYDIVSSLAYDQITDEMAFSIGESNTIGTITEISFRRAAKEIGLGEKLAVSRMYSLKEKLIPAISSAAEELEQSGFPVAADFKETVLNNGGISRL